MSSPYAIPTSYLRYEDTTVHLSFESIKQHEIDNIPIWMHAVDTHNNHYLTHHIHINASHPFIIAILRHIASSVPSYTTLHYIHIHHAENPLIDDAIQQVVRAVDKHFNRENITVHVDSSRGQFYL